jgi:hypothetical protein
VIRRVATLLAAGLLLCACGSISAGTAMSGWVKQSGFTANARSLFSDVKSSAKDLRNHSLNSNDLHTFCNVLYVDDGSMQSSLPTPDRQATNRCSTRRTGTSRAPRSSVTAPSSVPADRAKALTTLSNGAALFSEARARVAAAQS